MDCPWTIHVLNSYQHAGPSTVGVVMLAQLFHRLMVHDAGSIKSFPGVVADHITLSFQSWLFDARGKLPKEPFPVRPLADTRWSTLATLAAQAARQQSTGSELGPPSPALRANPFPKVTNPFCRLPLPTLFHRPEAVHHGDLMRL
ncbi:hypothetical protein Bca101_091094 [Brassica carinata]